MHDQNAYKNQRILVFLTILRQDFFLCRVFCTVKYGSKPEIFLAYPSKSLCFTIIVWSVQFATFKTVRFGG